MLEENKNTNENIENKSETNTETNIDNKASLKETPKHQDKLKALDNLSLGISMVVSVALGVGIGMLMKSWTGYSWPLFLGIFWGVAAAFLNVYRAYKRSVKEFEDLENDPRYAHRAKYGDKGGDEIESFKD